MRFRYQPHMRLRSKNEYDNVRKFRKCLKGRHFLAYYRINKLPHPRIGIISSKRNLRFSVDRNRIRRLIKEQFRLNQNEMPKLDIVFIAKGSSSQVTNKELIRCIENLLRQFISKA